MRITISGMPGSGKSTVAKMLAERLGHDHFSTGDLMRRMAEERGVTLEELQEKAEEDSSIDRELDENNRRLGERDDFVLDSRLGFHFIPEAVKIYLSVDKEVGAERILGDERPRERESKDVQDVAARIQERIDSENERYNRYYGVYIHDPALYDIAIDTTDMAPEEVVDAIVEIVQGPKR